MRLMIVTNQPVLAAGLEAALRSSPDIDSRCASPGDPALQGAIAASAPDILLIDFVPEESFGLLMALRERFPRCRIVLWVRKISAEIAYQALNLGVSGIARTTGTLLALEECLRAVGRGGTWFDEQSKAAFFEARGVALTAREAHLVILVSKGLKNKEIAAASGVSEATVRIYLSAIFKKLGVKDRYQLAIRGLTGILGERLLNDPPAGAPARRKRGQRVLFLEEREPRCAS
ncbi:MAG TPA: response regulator transcription factor [Bryobacteraceae bacterium]|jgi:DNA-binding NarL/FixJ family response regulator